MPDKNYSICFDTCLDKMYITLAKEETILDSRIVENHDLKYHSAFLISTIEQILNQNGIKPENLFLIGINDGPGSFTGIRACTTTARVMAQQLNIKATGISSLEIITRAYEEACHPPKPVLTALDARKNMAYLYKDNEVKGAIPLDEVKEIIRKGDFEVLTDDKLEPILGGKSYQKLNLPLGEILTKLAIKKSKTEDCDWKKLKPLYIQPPPMG